MPAYLLPTMLFPVGFYLMFGVGMAKGESKIATYLLATYGTFGLLGATFFGLGITIAIERGQGWMLLRQATPMRPQLHFAARILVTAAIGGAVVLLLFAAGAATGSTCPWAPGCALRRAGPGGSALRGDRPRLRPLAGAELGARDHQSDLPAALLPLRPVDPGRLAAGGAAEDRLLPAALPCQPAGARPARPRPRDLGLAIAPGAGGDHRAWPHRRAARPAARPRRHLRLTQA